MTFTVLHVHNIDSVCWDWNLEVDFVAFQSISARSVAGFESFKQEDSQCPELELEQLTRI